MANFMKAAGAQPIQPNIRPPAMPGQVAEPAPPQEVADNGQIPPTNEDMHQAVTHHLSSVAYNAKHAAAHQEETAKHSSALLNLLKKMPGFAKHAKRM